MSAIAETPERVFQGTVIELAERLGWRVAHFHDSRRQVRRRDGSKLYIGDKAAAGFPDLSLVRLDRLIFAELKREKGRLTAAQCDWIEALMGVRTAQLEHLGGPHPGPACPARAVEVYVWRPSDWKSIEAVLR